MFDMRMLVPRRLRVAAGLVSLQLNIGRLWSRAETNPPRPVSVPPIRLFGIVGTWFEADIIEATVRNAFAQGCERVFIVDNDSPDATVERAVAAGAEIACIYHTDYFQLNRQLAEINVVIKAVSTETDSDYVWWLLSDADEFVHGPGGLRIVDYLARLDRRFRVVGARVFEHFPTGEPANVPGHHPLDYQPLCHELRMAWCSLGHWKHPLIRWDRSGPELTLGAGFHRVYAPVKVLEPREGAFMHHFQFRNRSETSERLSRLCEAQEDGIVRSALNDSDHRYSSGARRRWDTLGYVYSQEWSRVDRRTPRGYRPGVNPKPWTSLVSPTDARIKRWYPATLSDNVHDMTL